MTNAGIFGPKLSGKTTLAKSLSLQYWTTLHIRSLVLDINNESWGEHCWITTVEEDFWSVVWKTRSCLVIVDEATETINRDKELLPVFTRLRHNQHKLLIIGHNGMNLLPMMREQLDTLYLFRQPKSAAKVWADVHTEDGLLAASGLRQYEFIFAQLFQKPQTMRLTL